MRTTFLRYLAATSAVLTLAACSESATGPGAVPSRGIAPQASAGLSRHKATTETYDFYLTENAAHYNLGVFALDVPDDAVCGSKSHGANAGRGNSCATLEDRQSIHVFATVSQNSTGGYSVNFSPSVLFSDDKQVVLSTYAFRSELPKVTKVTIAPSAFSFAPLGPAHQGPDLVTYFNGDGKEWARIYHFSGYVIASGQCDPAVDICP